MALLSEAEWHALSEAVRQAIEQIVSGSGYGQVTIECAAGAPREIHIAQSLRFRRDVYPCSDEEKIPQRGR